MTRRRTTRAKPRPEHPTYRDGVRGLRCRSCGSLLRDGADDVMVYLTLEDVERVAKLLRRGVDAGRDELITRLEQAAGRTVAQMKAST